jgi:outer membrane protein
MKTGKIFSLVMLIMLAAVAHGQSKIWTLQECIDYALSNNIQIRQTEAGNQMNRIDLEQSRWSRIPTLSANGSQGFNFGRNVDPFTNQYVNQSIHTNNFSLSGSVTLFNGFQNHNIIRQNQIDYESGKMEVATTKNDILLNVTSGYLQVLYGYEQVDVSKKQMESTEAQLDRTQKLVNAGSVPEINLLKIKSQLSSEKLSLINAENNLRFSKVTLMQTMDFPVTDDFEIERIAIPDSLIQNILVPSSNDIYNSALETQPQIKSYQLKKQSALVGVKVSEGARLPRLTASGNLFTGYSSARSINNYQTTYLQQDIGFLKSNPSEIVSGMVPVTTVTSRDYVFGKQVRDNFGQSISLNLFIPIVSNRSIRSNVERAHVNLLIAELNERTVRNSLRKTIEQAYADAKAAERRFLAAQENLMLQEQTFNQSKARYEIGAGNVTDFVVDKNNYVKGQSDFLQAKYEFMFRTKVLDFYKGKEIKF